ncbi:ABC transporter substrate-binding protein [Streptomyces lushanensis]|uniref:ABC transporter substrate-binding protein n=1 Tax=Streptomyces lushanensis TaxID=1434255 RepID=UPI000A9E0A21|nr:ABC transporter substrate-binding protein [Streptomyces lushanensis]
MRTLFPGRPRRSPAVLVAAALLLPVLAGCGTDTSSGSRTAGAASPAPSDDVTGSLTKNAELAKLLPENVRARGTFRIASAVSAPPTAYFPDASSGRPAGLDIDIADAVGRLLGLRPERQNASFEAILPALGSGKYDVGTGNFGVTDERRKTIDFVTYINDGQGFAVRKDDTSLNKVTALDELCGRTIGTGAGTTFEATLNAQKGVCADAGKKPYTVRVFSENGAVLTSLQQGRIDVVMSTINGLRYQASQPAAGVRFLGEFHRLDVGFAFDKGSPLLKAFQGAVNELIDDGTYARILKKWGTEDSAIEESRISPPETT